MPWEAQRLVCASAFLESEGDTLSLLAEIPGWALSLGWWLRGGLGASLDPAPSSLEALVYPAGGCLPSDSSTGGGGTSEFASNKGTSTHIHTQPESVRSPAVGGGVGDFTLQRTPPSHSLSASPVSVSRAGSSSELLASFV